MNLWFLLESDFIKDMISGIVTKIEIYSPKNQSSVTSVLLITGVTN